ncbi:hypothetical protein VMCG_01102 [Cytospora schulzeri]|uniref:Glycosyl hydrolase family 63 C-terminal domain-containing protein n=1 Tax=Cytospora schulzeri TaxID=448051 RepID=A0A423X6I5_9PEZI|nr:hypothetical protein VMCG_01102 [Valsa malicola]
MPNIRSTRLLVLALIVAIGLLYVGWYQPLAWDDGTLESVTELPPTADGIISDEKPSVPLGGSDRHDSHGSPSPDRQRPEPPASVEPTHTDVEGSGEGSDLEHPTTSPEEEVPPPAVPEKGAADEVPKPVVDCPLSFEQYMNSRPGPASTGSRQFPYVRPPPECRTFSVPAVDEYIEKMEGVIKDPDLYRLFQNSYPNTLDTMVKWHGYAQDENGTDTDQELSYIITGDIDAMWLRDSASQLYSYLPFLSPHNPVSNDNITSLNSLWRGLINSHARYIMISPYCHAFQPPTESGIPPTHNGAYGHNHPQPAYDPAKVFDCKWELDSLASFLQVSVGYYERTHDLAFFARHDWVPAVKAAVEAAAEMRLGTYDDEGRVLHSAWTFTGWTDRGSETLTNDGLGNPVRPNGMVRSAFRPSDDATIFQLLVPANMMFAKYLEGASIIMEELSERAVPSIGADKMAVAADLTAAMRDFAFGIRQGIDRDAVVAHAEFGEVFAYECDGYGGVNLMDDANIPSLLSMPLFGYAESRFRLPESPAGRDYARVYQNTRRFILSEANPYFSKGPVLSAVGGPHLGPGRAWPMAALVAGMTAFEKDTGLVGSKGEGGVQEVVAEQLGMVLDSTSGTGVVHESVHSWVGTAFTRAWFGWANGLLGELIMRIEEWEKKANDLEGGGLLGRSWQ